MRINEYFIGSSEDLPEKFYCAPKLIVDVDYNTAYLRKETNTYSNTDNIIVMSQNIRDDIYGELFGAKDYKSGSIVILRDICNAVYRVRKRIGISSQDIYLVRYNKKDTEQTDDGYFAGTQQEIVEFLSRLDTNIKKLDDKQPTVFEGDNTTGTLRKYMNTRDLVKLFSKHVDELPTNLGFGSHYNLLTDAIDIL